MLLRAIGWSLVLLAPALTFAADLPHLQTANGVTQLVVDDKPFLAIGGELGNSTASDPQTLEAALTKCQAMHLNAVMLPVYWDRIEFEQGKYDFSLLQSAIEQARKHDIHLVLLWFGTWKNSMSSYVPGWMKRDSQHFERARSGKGETLEIISPSSAAAAEADAKVFAAMMRFVKDFDASQQTVVMVQVENEMAMLSEALDHNPNSEAAYAGPVPQAILDAIGRDTLGPELAKLWKAAGGKTSGTWVDVFGSGPDNEEVSTAWQLATYTEHVAAAGKKEYPLPMFVNAALTRPGRHSTGGPLPHLLELWKLEAPSLDFLSPDVYFPSFVDWTQRYCRSRNPLFIPEMANTTRAPGNALYAISQLRAIGFGPFAIEDAPPAKSGPMSELDGLLREMSPIILEAQAQNRIVGMTPPISIEWNIDTQPQKATLGETVFTATFDKPTGAAATTQITELPTLGSGRWDAPEGTPDGAAMIIQIDAEDFWIVGRGVTVTFAPADGKGHVGIDQVQEGRFADGKWIGGRWLNGDQTHQGRHVRLEDDRWDVQRVKLYRYD